MGGRAQVGRYRLRQIPSSSPTSSRIGAPGFRVFYASRQRSVRLRAHPRGAGDSDKGQAGGMTNGTIWIGIGLLGQLLFSSRFLVQWIVSERRRESVIPLTFRWFSLAGGMTLLSHAVWRRGSVFILGQAAGLVLCPQPRPDPCQGARGRCVTRTHDIPVLRMRGTLAPAAAVIPGFAAVAAAGVLLRPVPFIDKTRYLAVPREIWARGDWLVPTPAPGSAAVPAEGKGRGLREAVRKNRPAERQGPANPRETCALSKGMVEC